MTALRRPPLWAAYKPQPDTVQVFRLRSGMLSFTDMWDPTRPVTLCYVASDDVPLRLVARACRVTPDAFYRRTERLGAYQRPPVQGSSQRTQWFVHTARAAEILMQYDVLPNGKGA